MKKILFGLTVVLVLSMVTSCKKEKTPELTTKEAVVVEDENIVSVETYLGSYQANGSCMVEFIWEISMTDSTYIFSRTLSDNTIVETIYPMEISDDNDYNVIIQNPDYSSIKVEGSLGCGTYLSIRQ